MAAAPRAGAPPATGSPRLRASGHGKRRRPRQVDRRRGRTGGRGRTVPSVLRPARRQDLRDIARITDYTPGSDALYLGADQVLGAVLRPRALAVLVASGTAGEPPDLILLNGPTDLSQVTFLASLPSGGIAPVTETYSTGAASNRLAQIASVSTPARAFSYDTAGNTLTEVRTLGAVADSWAYADNAQNRLASVMLNASLQAEYLYNHAGHQVSRTVWQAGSPVTTVTVHDQAGVRLGEYDGATGGLLREYIWLGQRPLAVLEDGDLFHLHVDHIHRPVMATDASGAVVWRASYTPFGGIESVTLDTNALTEQGLRFPGQWFEAKPASTRTGTETTTPPPEDTSSQTPSGSSTDPPSTTMQCKAR